MKKIWILLLVVLGFWATDRLCRKATDGFAVLKMAPLIEGFHSRLSPPQEIFKQRFVYLAKGGQCYAFASEDGRYVLKFFRKGAPVAFASVMLAEERLATETGLVYAHLEKRALPPLQIVDKLHIAHTIDPNAYVWILQRRAELVPAYLTTLMNQGKVEEAKLALSNLFALLHQIHAKGIGDGDPNLVKNFGFVDDKPVEIDIGRFSLNETSWNKFEQSKEDLLYWLNAHYPILSPSLS